MYMQEIKDKVPSMSYADLYQLASVVAVEYAGGPAIPFRLGRKDAKEKDTTPDGRLPDAKQGTYIYIFWFAMTLTLPKNSYQMVQR